MPTFFPTVNKFALLTDRKLTQAQSNALCQNVYGTSLATMYTYYEFKQIGNILSNTSHIDDAWIGLHFDNKTYNESNYFDNEITKYQWKSRRVEAFIFDSWT